MLDTEPENIKSILQTYAGHSNLQYKLTGQCGLRNGKIKIKRVKKYTCFHLMFQGVLSPFVLQINIALEHWKYVDMGVSQREYVSLEARVVDQAWNCLESNLTLQNKWIRIRHQEKSLFISLNLKKCDYDYRGNPDTGSGSDFVFKSIYTTFSKFMFQFQTKHLQSRAPQIFKNYYVSKK